MKSFSEQTKTELINYTAESSCCTGAELSGMLISGCYFNSNEIRFAAENLPARKRFVILCGECGVDTNFSEDTTFAKESLRIIGKDKVEKILKKCNIILNDTEENDSLEYLDFEDYEDFEGYEANYILPEDYLKSRCCRCAFLRGVFMASGTIVDPQKNYNLELVARDELLGQLLLSVLKEEGFDFKTVKRKSRYVLYIKTAGGIQDFLSYIGAYQSQMELINITIEKEIRNDFVRSLNSESANLDKTIEASVRQTNAINIIQEKMGLDNLSEELKAIAKLRLENPSVSLGELGKLLKPPLGKSGVNHRMKKIEAIAEKLKD